MQEALNQIDDFRRSLAQETYLSPSRVQDRLLDLWASLQGTPAVVMVEKWLTLTVERELFSGAELAEFLNDLEAYMKVHETSSRVPQA